MMPELIYYSTFLLNSALSLWLVMSINQKIKQKKTKLAKGKNIYSALMLPIGELCGTVYFWLLAKVFGQFGINVSFGNGEIIIAAVMFNLILSLFLMPIGRVYLGWQKIKF